MPAPAREKVNKTQLKFSFDINCDINNITVILRRLRTFRKFSVNYLIIFTFDVDITFQFQQYIIIIIRINFLLIILSLIVILAIIFQKFINLQKRILTVKFTVCSCRFRFFFVLFFCYRTVFSTVPCCFRLYFWIFL